MYLGFDLSTQSLTAVLLDEQGQLQAQHSVNFGDRLKHYEAPSGFVRGEQEGEFFSDAQMWLEALDLLLEEFSQETDLSQVKSISSSAQQHATVWLNNNFSSVLERLPQEANLADALRSSFSRRLCPIWMDHSTTQQCHDFANAAGSAEWIQQQTGSLPAERFCAAQIRKVAEQQPELYQDTAHIHLASSFLSSVLTGQQAPLDYGDGAGMNLLDLRQLDWDKELLEATAPQLKERLPQLQPAASVAGQLNAYFKRYGFSDNVDVITASGDNPCSLIGSGGALPGRAVISLGTSDTFFAALNQLPETLSGPGHVFGNPAGGYMYLLCFRNGSLMRESLCERFGLDWQQFGEVISTDNGSGEVYLPFLEEEITPAVKASEASREALENADSTQIVRGFILGQIFNMLHHGRSVLPHQLSEIVLTGGASRNDALAQLIADVAQMPVHCLESTASAAIGAALRALQHQNNLRWSKINEYLPVRKSFDPGLKPQGEERFREKLQNHFEQELELLPKE